MKKRKWRGGKEGEEKKILKGEKIETRKYRID